MFTASSDCDAHTALFQLPINILRIMTSGHMSQLSFVLLMKFMSMEFLHKFALWFPPRFPELKGSVKYTLLPLHILVSWVGVAGEDYLQGIYIEE